MSLPELPLDGMADRHYGLTKALADSYIEAARVCLDRHHLSPTQFSVENGEAFIDASVRWVKADERTLNAWANEIDATRDGAYACALAAVEMTFGMVAVRRAENLTGADYYIGEKSDLFDDLEGCLRLEVSGVDKGDVNIINYRLKSKIEQAAVGKSNLPAMACVIGFRACKIMLRLLEAS